VSTLWALPAGLVLATAVVLLVAMARVAAEATRVRAEVARWRELRPAVVELRRETAAAHQAARRLRAR
jgi:cytochrome c-type biogenesis protein CcmH/NrfF